MICAIDRRECLAALGAVAVPGAWAQPRWPEKMPIALTVGLQAGTGSDTAARDLVQKVSVALGQQFVVSNMAGAAGLVAAQDAARSPADGYHLVALSAAAVTTLPHLQKGYFPSNLLVPIAMMGAFPSVICIHPGVPAQSIGEFLELARRNPGRYSYASGGNGSVQHTATEQLKAMAGIDLLHVPYKGMGQATTDLVGGHVHVAIMGVVVAIPFIKTGQLRVLAWTGSRRNQLFPDLPTLQEAGVRGYHYQPWTAMFAPVGVPREIVTRLNTEARRAAAAPDLNSRWMANGVEAVDFSPQQIAELIRTESEQMAKLIRDTGMKA